MASVSGRYVAVYNGEIYNFEAMRRDLENAGVAPQWRGHSDTEVLLAACEAWGPEAALRKCVGMFALALWDRQRRTLILARDRVGEKPIYYGFIDGCLLFASELKAIRAAVHTGLRVDRMALSQFMQFGYVPAPHTIHAGIRKLPPGHLVEIRSVADHPEPQPYWLLRAGDAQALRVQLAGATDDELLDHLHDRLNEAVRIQLVSDVPLGAFLSGGVDSSTIVALMQANSRGPVRTYTVGFQEGPFNEAPYAKAVAAHLGTEHTELYVTPQMAAEVIPDLPTIYDEPFADSSQIPTTLVSRLTRQHVTVSLSGDGGDELFAGYPRYQITQALWHRVRRRPMALRRAGASVLRMLSPQAWDTMLTSAPFVRRRNINGRRIHRFAQLATTRSLGEMYVRLMSQWQPEDGLVVGVSPELTVRGDWSDGDVDGINAMRRWDVGQYLPDDLLVKVDRAAMSASLESRAPMLDHRVVELAMALPNHLLVRNGVGKWALRRVLDRYVPRELIDRPKTGFEVPLAQWLRGPLRDWADALMDTRQLVDDGLLDPAKVRSMWEQHLSGRFDRSLLLWSVLMFQSWLRANQRPIR